MTPDSYSPSTSKGMLWTGRVLTVLAGLGMIASGAMKFSKSEDATKGFAELGWPIEYAPILGVTEIACAILYLIPYTSGLGAILLTGYLGGAVATHARLGQPVFIIPIIFGVVVWLGLYFRDARLRAVVPIRKL